MVNLFLILDIGKYMLTMGYYILIMVNGWLVLVNDTNMVERGEVMVVVNCW